VRLAPRVNSESRDSRSRRLGLDPQCQALLGEFLDQAMMIMVRMVQSTDIGRRPKRGGRCGNVQIIRMDAKTDLGISDELSIMRLRRWIACMRVKAWGDLVTSIWTSRDRVAGWS
jgi:hypothetical protein